MVDFSLSEEQRALIDTARRFTKERIIPIAAECDRESKFLMEVFETGPQIKLAALGEDAVPVGALLLARE